MANDVVIRITGQDGVTNVFRKIGSEADRMGREVDQAADRGGRSLDRLSKAGAAVGAVFSVVQGAISDAARASEESAQVQRQLEQAIANTGDSYEVYAARIEAAGAAAVQLGIDDEKAAQAIQALTEITGDAGTALDLLGTAQDVAAAKGIDLVSAAELVGRVHEGNVGILQRYGVVVSEGATAEEALAQIQGQVAGQAEAHATTMGRLTVEFGNLQEKAGALLGDLAPYIGLLPGISAGWTAVSSAIGAVIPKQTALSAGSKLLSLAMGPAGIVGAAGLAAIAVYKVAEAFDNVNLSTSEVEAGIRGVQEAIADLGKSGAATEQTSALADEMATLQALAQASAKASSELTDAQYDLAVAQEQAQSSLRSGNQAQYEADQRVVEAAEDRLAAVQANILSDKQWTDVQKDLVAIFSDPNPLNEGLVADRVDDLREALLAGEISARDYVKAIDDLEKHSDSFGLSLDEIATQQRAVTDETVDATKATDEHKRAVAAYGDALGDLISPAAASAETLSDINHILGSTVPAADGARRALADAFAEFEAGTMPAEEFEGRADAISDSLGLVESRTRAMAEANGEAAMAASGLYEVLPGTGQAMLDAAAAAAEQDEKLREATGGYYGLFDGITSAKDALAAFKETQDRLLESQDVFNKQQSEYESQIRAIEAALDIINEKQAAGIALSKQEIDIRDRSTAALERLEGGVEDATLASADLAIQYGENMRVGDELNDTLGENAGSASGVERAIRDLIEALHGIPGYVSTQIDANTADAHAAVDDITSRFNALNGSHATLFVDVIQSGSLSQSDLIGALGQDGLTARYADGGTTSYGRDAYGALPKLAHGGTLALVGERGPELVTLPGGAQVMNTEGSRARVRAGRGGMRFQNFGNITLAPNEPSRFGRELRRQWAAEEART